MADNSFADIQGAGIGDLNTTLKIANQNMSQLIQAIKAAFPQASASVITTATAGSLTLPANPSKFLSVTINGTAYVIPMYNP